MVLQETVIRERYVEQLAHLREDILQLGRMVEHALDSALASFETRSETTAAEVINGDSKIDQMQQDVESKVITLIATQQPVAGDLRLVGSVFAIAGELERIGDYASGIARRVRRMAGESDQVTPPAGLEEMGTLARTMLNTSLLVFLEQNATFAHSLTQSEERMDILEDRLHAELITLAQHEPQRLKVAVDMLDIVHLLERVADRATNIGERVIYIETSTLEPLNT